VESESTLGVVRLRTLRSIDTGTSNVKMAAFPALARVQEVRLLQFASFHVLAGNLHMMPGGSAEVAVLAAGGASDASNG
jgi:hypothetical protein